MSILYLALIIFRSSNSSDSTIYEAKTGVKRGPLCSSLCFLKSDGSILGDELLFKTHQHELVPHLRNEYSILMIKLMELNDNYFGLKSLCSNLDEKPQRCYE